MMEEIKIIVELINSFNVPAWIPIATGALLRFLELRWNIFSSSKIK